MGANDEKNVLLHFEKIGDAKFANDSIEEHMKYLLPMKRLLDNEFEEILISFNEDEEWNKIYNIQNMENASQMIEKCVYLMTTKVCILQKQDSYVYKASIK